MDLRAVAMGVAFAFMWSSAFTSARIIVEYAPPLTALSIRFLISGVIAIGLALLAGQSWKLTRSQWMATFVFGICQNALYLGLNFVALQTVEASLAAIIASSLPLWVALAGWLLFRDKVPMLGVAGLIAGFGGAALILGTRITEGVDLFGVLLCIIGVFALTFATLILRGASSGGNVMMIVGLQMIVGSISLAPFAALSETWDVEWTWQLLAAFAYTTIVPGLLATWVWFTLVRRIGAVPAATFHFLNPFFGVAVAAALLSEKLGTLDLIGVAVITLGILAVQLSKRPAV